MDLKINGVVYSTRRMNAFEQFSIARRFADVLTVLAMAPDRARIKQRFPQAFCALTSRLPQAEVQDAIVDCLSFVSRAHEGSLSPIIRDRVIMFSDINESMPLMLELIYAVFEGERLLDFFADPESISKAPDLK